MKKTLTVFTPAYNRAHTIGRTYESLCRQTCKDFEWLVVDDGSTDDTLSKLKAIQLEHDDSFPIRVITRENKGLMQTINQAVDMAEGTFFCRLDSDDYATEEAVELICHYGQQILNDDSLCAVAFLSLKPDHSINGYHPFIAETRCNFTDYRAVFKGTGDRSEVMKTAIFRKFKFPSYSNEKFCPEGLLWNRIALKYSALYIPKGIYIKTDAGDSITATIYNCLKSNCQGTCQYYYEIVTNRKLPFKYRWLATIKYYRYALYARRPVFKGIPMFLMLTGLPVGLLVVVYDKYQHHNK